MKYAMGMKIDEIEGMINYLEMSDMSAYARMAMRYDIESAIDKAEEAGTISKGQARNLREFLAMA